MEAGFPLQHGFSSARKEPRDREVPLGELVKAGPWLRRCWVKSQTKGWVLKGR